MNGEIRVESRQGVGTTFTMILREWTEDTATDKREEDADVKALVGS
jgi:hypothetical protein